MSAMLCAAAAWLAQKLSRQPDSSNGLEGLALHVDCHRGWAKLCCRVCCVVCRYYHLLLLALF